MKAVHVGPVCLIVTLLVSLPLNAQQAALNLAVPENFTEDLKMAARLRPLFLSQSTEASGCFPLGKQVLQLLVQRLLPQESSFRWELRIIDDDVLNAFASPDGTIYVGRSLAQLAGRDAGLWAAILSHEVTHVVHRDWARRYIYEKSLNGGSVALVLGDHGLNAGTWIDSDHALESVAAFCREMELQADADGMELMARAGYHPDFVAALHHLLNVQDSSGVPASSYAMHPRWETRDQDLARASAVAAMDFDRRWPEWFDSPGGDPPLVVFVEAPLVKSLSSNRWQVRVPLQCQNLAGAVEVVLRLGKARSSSPRDAAEQSSNEFRELTGCTSKRTVITFNLKEQHGKPSGPWASVLVLDAEGSVISRMQLP